MFFVGYYNSDQTYVDFLPKVVKRHLSSPLLFWCAAESGPWLCIGLDWIGLDCIVMSHPFIAAHFRVR
jgi:hypothetical protein